MSVVSTVSGRVRQYPGGCWLELLLEQLGLKLANLPPLSPSLSLSLVISSANNRTNHWDDPAAQFEQLRKIYGEPPMYRRRKN